MLTMGANNLYQIKLVQLQTSTFHDIIAISFIKKYYFTN